MPRKTAAKTATTIALPDALAPELATLVAAAPRDSDEWLYEVKFDGYRMLVRVDGNSIRLISRNDNDWTPKLEPLRAELERMDLPPGWYDGEIVVNDTEGRPDFGLLQNAFDRKRAENITMYLFTLSEHRRELPQALLVKIGPRSAQANRLTQDLLARFKYFTTFRAKELAAEGTREFANQNDELWRLIPHVTPYKYARIRFCLKKDVHSVSPFRAEDNPIRERKSW